MLLFLQSDGSVPTDELIGLVRQSLRDRLSPRHIPDEVYLVPMIPRTPLGKRLEVPIKRVMDAGSAGGAVGARIRAVPGYR